MPACCPSVPLSAGLVLPMSREPNLYHRHTLYDEVWKEPLLTVSKRYGVSDVSLAMAGQAPGGRPPRRGC